MNLFNIEQIELAQAKILAIFFAFSMAVKQFGNRTTPEDKYVKYIL